MSARPALATATNARPTLFSRVLCSSLAWLVLLDVIAKAVEFHLGAGTLIVLSLALDAYLIRRLAVTLFHD